MLRCLIVDDEPNAVALLEKYVSRLPELQLVGSCYDGVEALRIIRSEQVDVVFLDINMPEINGMELVKLLSPHQKVVFTTAYSEYAVESYEYQAVDYLLKPITFVRFTAAVEKLLANVSATSNEAKPKDWLMVKSGTELLRLKLSEIKYVKGEREYVSIHTTELKHLIYKRMKELLKDLPVQFVRVHHSYIINTDRIEKVVDHKVYVDGEEIPISQSYRSGFMKLIEGGLG